MYTPPFNITDEILQLVSEISEQIGATMHTGNYQSREDSNG